MRASVAVVLSLESLADSRFSLSVAKTARICATYMGSDDAVHESPLPEAQSCISLYKSYCTGVKNVAQERSHRTHGVMQGLLTRIPTTNEVTATCHHILSACHLQ